MLKYMLLSDAIATLADGEPEDTKEFHRVVRETLKARATNIVYLCPELDYEGWQEFWAKAGPRVVDLGTYAHAPSAEPEAAAFSFRVKELNLFESYRSTKRIKFIHSSDESLDSGDGIEAVHIRKADYDRLMEE